eukprot:jgi/Psemu1/3973/gm1.3973_g
MSYTSGSFATAAQLVATDDTDGIPRNTKLAYDRKGTEFIQFCQTTIFENTDYPLTVRGDKVFGFLFYQAYRARRKRGRRKVRMEQEQDVSEGMPKQSPTLFDAEEYLSVMAQFNDQLNHVNGTASVPVTSLLVMDYDPPGYDTKRIKNEKIDLVLLPYMNVQNIERIKQFFFSQNADKSRTYYVAALRDRLCFLMTHGGVLCGESVFKCELLDLCNLIKYDKVAHACQIFIMQILTGKTNGTKTLHGRVMRNKNVVMCPIGALGFYLMARFHRSNQLNNYGFADNLTWFDVKLRTNVSSARYDKLITDQAYAKLIRTAGRGTGAVALEMEELPLKAMRALAGHSQDMGSFYFPPSLIDPPNELQEHVFPYLNKAMKKVVTCPDPKPTAQAFLMFLKNLQLVVLQDTALLMHQGRISCLFALPLGDVLGAALGVSPEGELGAALGETLGATSALGEPLRAIRGTALGAALGAALGETQGARLGAALGAVLRTKLDDTLEASLGAELGDTLGAAPVAALGVAPGAALGETLGATLDAALGETLGAGLGAVLVVTLGATLGETQRATLGAALGLALSAALGETLGATLGAALGETVGAGLGAVLVVTLGAASGETLRATLGAALGLALTAAIDETLGPQLVQRLVKHLEQHLQNTGDFKQTVDSVLPQICNQMIANLYTDIGVVSKDVVQMKNSIFNIKDQQDVATSTIADLIKHLSAFQLPAAATAATAATTTPTPMKTLF